MEAKEYFRNFVTVLDKELHQLKDEDKRTNFELLMGLCATENKFRKMLISTVEGRQVYAQFMWYILEERGNILQARAFFRERQHNFDKLAAAFKMRRPSMLHKFRTNYVFAKWAMERYAGHKHEQLQVLFEKIAEYRDKYARINLPLILNQTKIFWSKKPDLTLDYLDLVGYASEGFMNALDKWVPDEGGDFNAVAIGRMLVNMVEAQYDTMVTLTPMSSRIHRRASKARQLFIDEAKVLAFVKESFPNTTAADLAEIDSVKTGLTDISTCGDVSLGDVPRPSPEAAASSQEVRGLLRACLGDLCTFDRKIVKMKYGV